MIVFKSLNFQFSSFLFGRPFSKNKFNSFIAIHNNTIIAHVGFVSYNYGYDNSKIYPNNNNNSVDALDDRIEK